MFGQKRVFVSGGDTYLGRALVDALMKEKTNLVTSKLSPTKSDDLILGTVEALEEAISSDIIILNNMGGAYEASSFAHYAANLNQKPLVILLSSLVTWANTPIPASGVLDEKNWRYRRPHPSATRLFEIENEIMALPNSFVIASGLIWGGSGGSLFDIARNEWYSNTNGPVSVPSASSISEENSVPTIKVQYLVEYCLSLIYFSLTSKSMAGSITNPFQYTICLDKKILTARELFKQVAISYGNCWTKSNVPLKSQIDFNILTGSEGIQSALDNDRVEIDNYLSQPTFTASITQVSHNLLGVTRADLHPTPASKLLTPLSGLLELAPILFSAHLPFDSSRCVIYSHPRIGLVGKRTPVIESIGSLAPPNYFPPDSVPMRLRSLMLAVPLSTVEFMSSHNLMPARVYLNSTNQNGPTSEILENMNGVFTGGSSSPPSDAALLCNLSVHTLSDDLCVPIVTPKSAIFSIMNGDPMVYGHSPERISVIRTLRTQLQAYAVTNVTSSVVGAWKSKPEDTAVSVVASPKGKAVKAKGDSKASAVQEPPVAVDSSAVQPTELSEGDLQFNAALNLNIDKKVPLPLLACAVRAALTSPLCLRRGFVLDGFPQVPLLLTVPDDSDGILLPIDASTNSVQLSSPSPSHHSKDGKDQSSGKEKHLKEEQKDSSGSVSLGLSSPITVAAAQGAVGFAARNRALPPNGLVSHLVAPTVSLVFEGNFKEFRISPDDRRLVRSAYRALEASSAVHKRRSSSTMHAGLTPASTAAAGPSSANSGSNNASSSGDSGAAGTANDDESPCAEEDLEGTDEEELPAAENEGPTVLPSSPAPLTGARSLWRQVLPRARAHAQAEAQALAQAQLNAARVHAQQHPDQPLPAELQPSFNADPAPWDDHFEGTTADKLYQFDVSSIVQSPPVVLSSSALAPELPPVAPLENYVLSKQPAGQNNNAWQADLLLLDPAALEAKRSLLNVDLLHLQLTQANASVQSTVSHVLGASKLAGLPSPVPFYGRAVLLEQYVRRIVNVLGPSSPFLSTLLPLYSGASPNTPVVHTPLDLILQSVEGLDAQDASGNYVQKLPDFDLCRVFFLVMRVSGLVLAELASKARAESPEYSSQCGELARGRRTGAPLGVDPQRPIADRRWLAALRHQRQQQTQLQQAMSSSANSDPNTGLNEESLTLSTGGVLPRPLLGGIRAGRVLSSMGTRGSGGSADLQSIPLNSHVFSASFAEADALAGFPAVLPGADYAASATGGTAPVALGLGWESEERKARELLALESRTRNLRSAWTATVVPALVAALAELRERGEALPLKPSAAEEEPVDEETQQLEATKEFIAGVVRNFAKDLAKKKGLSAREDLAAE